MSGLRYGRRKSPVETFVQVMNIVNFSLAIGVFLAWPGYAEVLADPMSVIAGSGSTIRPSVLEYPFVLLWLIPLAGACGAYVTSAVETTPLARFFAAFPLLLALACGGWLYFYVGFWG